MTIKHDLKVINLWGAPCSGKSTTASGLFKKMKVNNYNVELVHEYAKDMVWDRAHPDHFSDQFKISAHQHERQLRLAHNNVRWAISDSPLLMAAMYQPVNYYKTFLPFLMEVSDSFTNINFFLKRNFDYVELGRNKSEQEANKISEDILYFLHEHSIPYTVVPADFSADDFIFNIIDGSKKDET